MVLAAIAAAGLAGGCDGPAGSAVGGLAWRDTAVALGPDTVRAVRVGRLAVPRGPQADGTVSVRLVRLLGAGTGAASPIVYLPPQGGRPAIEELARQPGSALDSLRTVADVIALDPRGTGGSGPTPHGCGELAWPFEGHGAPDDAWLRRIGRACADSARAAGIEPGSVGVTAVARDLDALREALGVRQLTLLAEGAGAAVAAVYAAHFPDRVDRIVLLRPATPGYVLDRPRAYARALAALDTASAGTGLRALLDTATDSLEARVRAGAANDGHLVLISAWDLRRMIIEALRSPAGRDSLPAWLRDTAAADWGALAEYVHGTRQSAPLHVAELAAACSVIRLAARGEGDARGGNGRGTEPGGRVPDAGSAGTLFADAVPWPYPSLCPEDVIVPAALQPRQAAPEGGPEPGVPTLVVRGALDPVTAPLPALAPELDVRRLTVDGVTHQESPLARSHEALNAVLTFLRM